ncbi:LysM-like peptidoglycan-binding domain-containing protein [Tatumella sp. UBA2305]|uniref:LysM-like peptidoglycan-binding domain-containing protein n=1 Tax=Tatumella sp. UBA2305 TaxID=1947647 RepID=UPI0025FCCECB|nr:LysM-like peptidoglycan-binding domain-containing protein [Tatumella sp. UBA2305]
MRKQENTAGQSSLLSSVRHWPRKLHWMDPLPLSHRWGIFAGLMLVVIGFLLPGQSQQFPVQRPLNHNSTVMQAQLDNSSDSSSSVPAPSSDDPQGQWHNYQIAEGQTLAQLFRDNNLPVSDVFAMANVEGADKPLSNLQTGQQIRLRINARGTVTGLTLNGSNGPVLFVRQSNGSFIQAQ